MRVSVRLEEEGVHMVDCVPGDIGVLCGGSLSHTDIVGHLWYVCECVCRLGVYMCVRTECGVDGDRWLQKMLYEVVVIVVCGLMSTV